MILAGDIGGTKAVLARCTRSGECEREAVFLCANYPSFDAILDEFLRGDAVGAACFGVAGPVVDGVARITNLPWTIDAHAIEGRLGIPVLLLNDLQATAFGMLALRPAAFAVLQEGSVPEPHGTIAVLAPGTGLGESMLVWDGRRYVALPSEGGHADFAPQTDEEVELFRYLQGLYGSHVSYERVLSGNGIGDLYGFARATGGEAEPAWLTQAIAAGDRNAVVSSAALAGTDAACIRALALFAEILGAEAGNLALRGLATGGVVIGGGIPPKLLPALQSGRLIARFNNKGRFSAWTRSLNVRVALEPRAALFGAAHFSVTNSQGST